MTRSGRCNMQINTRRSKNKTRHKNTSCCCEFPPPPSHAAVFRLLFRCFFGCVRACRSTLSRTPKKQPETNGKMEISRSFPNWTNRSDHIFPPKEQPKKKNLTEQCIIFRPRLYLCFVFFCAPSFRFTFAGSILYLLSIGPFADYGCYSFSLTSVFFFFLCYLLLPLLLLSLYPFRSSECCCNNNNNVGPLQPTSTLAALP